MSDDPIKRAPQDAKRINMNQEHEVKYWTAKFGVTRDQLQQAVQSAGPMADAVERQLRGS